MLLTKKNVIQLLYEASDQIAPYDTEKLELAGTNIEYVIYELEQECSICKLDEIECKQCYITGVNFERSSKTNN